MASGTSAKGRWPTITVSVGRDEHAELAKMAEERGFTSERGALPGGLVRAILRRQWAWLRALRFDPSQCDISPVQAWMLAQMRLLRQRDPRLWRRVIEQLAELAELDVPEEVRAALEDAAPGPQRKRTGNR